MSVADVPAPGGRAATRGGILAHEMEHVCEQIEGVDLRALAATKRTGVYDLAGHYETTRAIRAGQRVTREYLGDADEPRLTKAAY